MMFDVPLRSNKFPCFGEENKCEERGARLHYGVLSNYAEAIYSNCIKPVRKTGRANFHVVLALENILGDPR